MPSKPMAGVRILEVAQFTFVPKQLDSRVRSQASAPERLVVLHELQLNNVWAGASRQRLECDGNDHGFPDHRRQQDQHCHRRRQ